MQVRYVWSGAVPVSLSELAINDYMFVSQTVGSSNITTKLGNHFTSIYWTNNTAHLTAGSKSSLYIEFTFSRTLGYYLMREIYPDTAVTRSSCNEKMSLHALI